MSDRLAPYLLPASTEADFAAAIEKHLLSTYQQAQADELRKLGYAVSVQNAIAIPHPSGKTLARVKAIAAKAAHSIVATYNRMLGNVPKRLPADATDDDVRRAADQFRAGALTYNRETLAPFLNRVAEQEARRDVYRTNPSLRDAVTWHVEPTDTAGLDDVCDEAVARGEMTTAEAEEYEFPAHPNCPHELVASDIGTDELPSEDQIQF